MSNGQACCITGVCCDGAKQRKALARKLEKDMALAEGHGDELSAYILDNWDLLPAGSLTELKAQALKHED